MAKRGPAIQAKMFEYFSTRPNWVVHLPELATALGETDLARVQRGVLNLRKSHTARADLEIVQRGTAWRWIPRTGSGLPGSNDPTAAPADSGDTAENWDAESPNPLLHGIGMDDAREPCDDPQCDCHIPPYEDKSRDIPNPFGEPAPEDVDRGMLRTYMNTVGHASATDQALRDALELQNEFPTVAEWTEAQQRQKAGDPRSRLAIAADLLISRVNGRLQAQAHGLHISPGTSQWREDRARAHQIGVVTDEKPRNAFDVPETMFQRVGTTEDDAAILKDEDGHFWRAVRI